MHPLLDRLDKVTGRNGKYTACCPAHNDNNPSLAVSVLDDGRTLIHCYAGCEPPQIMAAVGLTMSDLFPDGDINDQLRGATPWLRKQRIQASQNSEFNATILRLAQAKRDRGERLTKQELREERIAYQDIGRGKARLRK